MFIIDRYIAKEFIKYFLAAMIITVTLFMAINMLTGVWELKADSSTIWLYYLYDMPRIIYFMMPVSALVATIFTVSMMSRNNELVALFSAGQNLFRIALPILILVILSCAATFLFSDKIAPHFAKKRNYVYYVQIKKQPGMYYTVKTNKIWYRSKDLIYNIKTFDTQKNSVQGLTIYYFSPDWKLMQLTTAGEGIFEGNNWRLKNGTVTLFDNQNSFPLTQNFKEKIINLEEKPADLQSLENNSEVMTSAEIGSFINKNREAALDTKRYEVAFHSRYGFAFVGFVMSLLGIPFSVSRERSGGGFALNVGICFTIVFGYYLLISIFNSLGNRGTLSGFLAAWLPNLIMLILGVRLLLRDKR